ncbi:MAG: hypothetical protein ACOX7X_02100 [Methanosarcina flavescens]|uniref:Uncharacterized protein n=1 Tax=Methanosarcina flavescens TaxID=1715806 RepID=A0A660HNR9_9EURY|nr:hypothetical protein [Methanosarcina flavescens]AYK13862.1 hypothetical protein AOB57_000320 [Methanosarcina flavescens]NLK31953.1 hypothetical protein [Methanosarcina flavescens]
MTILTAMNSSKSENSALPSHLTDLAAREKSLARQVTPIYESATFSSPVLDQFRGIMPDFNKRLSPDRNLGLSSSCHLRLSPETLPRLASSSCTGISSAALPESIFETSKMPAGKGLEILPDLSGKMLAEAGIRTLSADLPMAPLASRFVTLRQAEGLKETEKDRE